MTEMMAKKRAEMAEQKKEKEEEEVPDNLFDGGFFKVSSPVRSPKPSSPRTPPVSGEKPKESGADLRRSVLTESSRRSVSGLLLSPFISQVARRSLTPSSSPGSLPFPTLTQASPPTATLVNVESQSSPASRLTVPEMPEMPVSPSGSVKDLISLSKTPRTPTYPVRRSSRISLGTPK